MEEASSDSSVFHALASMPRNKRQSSEIDLDEDRQFSKRSRNHINARRTSKDSAVFTQRRCVQLFRDYTTAAEPETMGPEGMEKFCADLGVEPENVVMLVLAWKMNARQMGYFTLQEWLRGFLELQCDTIPKIQGKLTYLKSLLNDHNTFKNIYRYAYDFARQDKDQRSMDIDTAKAMLKLLLGKHWALFNEFNTFLDHSKYKVINKDQWCNIFEFSRTIHSDLSNYDVDGAWPVMLDEFVEWLNSSKNDETYSS